MKLLIFGIIQGLTEFLPISSSGHLYLLKKIINIEGAALSFFVVLHLATLCAIFAFFLTDLKHFFNPRLFFHICFITAITGAIGLGIKCSLSQFFETRYFVPSCLLVNGGMLLAVKPYRGDKNYTDLELKNSILLGILQGIAVFPGISRSGITISTLLRQGFDKKEAFRLSFFIAIPAIFGAFLIEAKEIFALKLPASNITLGFLSAFLCGLLALKLLKKTIISDNFKKFGYYCLAISLIGFFR